MQKVQFTLYLNLDVSLRSRQTWTVDTRNSAVYTIGDTFEENRTIG